MRHLRDVGRDRRGGQAGERRLGRRAFLGGFGGALVLAACGDSRRVVASSLSCGAADVVDPRLPDEIHEDPFALGVASGDPLADAVVLWTRLALRSAPLEALPPVDVPVTWEIARDDGFRDVVGEGSALASPATGHALHVDVGGLDPATTYWFRFRAGPWRSPTGRTRTAPPRRSRPDRVRFAGQRLPFDRGRSARRLTKASAVASMRMVAPSIGEGCDAAYNICVQECEDTEVAFDYKRGDYISLRQTDYLDNCTRACDEGLAACEDEDEEEEERCERFEEECTGSCPTDVFDYRRGETPLQRRCRE